MNPFENWLYLWLGGTALFVFVGAPVLGVVFLLAYVFRPQSD